MEELEDDPSSEMLAIELYRPAVYAARTFDLLYVLRQASCVCTCTLPFHSPPPLLCLIQVPTYGFAMWTRYCGVRNADPCCP